MFIKTKKAEPLLAADWLETLERCRKSFGLEGVAYEYYSYPAPSPEGSVWIRNHKRVILFLSHGFLKSATESQVVVLMENLSVENFSKVRYGNKQKTFQMMMKRVKGESRLFRYWIISFLVYPLERLLKIARI